MRRVHLRGKQNIAKRALVHATAFNLSLILRIALGVGTPRRAADGLAAVGFWFLWPVECEQRGIRTQPVGSGRANRSLVSL